MELEEWINYCQDLLEKVRINKKHILELEKSERKRISDITDELREKFIFAIIPKNEINEAIRWINELVKEIDELKHKAGIKGVTFAKEMKSFLEDPLLHLKKKIFNYVFDLLNGNLRIADFIMKAGAAIRTSLRTNMRSIYQAWVFLVLIDYLLDNGRIIYPEHKFLYIERNRRQSIGILPPNCIVEFDLGKRLSFFIEVPRPLSWHDSSDLSRVWRFYVALRPDFMVYSGTEMNIALPEQSPPIKRPNVIIECKELEDWYKRTRDLRGWWSKAITAEKWRSLWLRGLIKGLADAMGVKTKEELMKVTSEKKSLRVKEYRLVQIYKRFYKPDDMILITRTHVPKEIKNEIESSGLLVFDNINFKKDKLEEVVEILKRFGKCDTEDLDLISIIKREFNLNMNGRIISKAVLNILRKHSSDFLQEINKLKDNQGY